MSSSLDFANTPIKSGDHVQIVGRPGLWLKVASAGRQFVNLETPDGRPFQIGRLCITEILPCEER